MEFTDHPTVHTGQRCAYMTYKKAFAVYQTHVPGY